MLLRHIEIFQAVLQAGTLTGAAKLLNVSQPAASKLLAQAERRLGFALFARVHGRLQLTPEGQLLRGRVEQVSDELGEIRRLASSIRRAGRNYLRVISTPALANVLVPEAVSKVRSEYPDTSVELATEHSREIMRSLLLRETDLGLTLQEIRHPGIEQETISQGGLVVIAPAGHWSNRQLRRPVDLSELAGLPMIGIAIRDALGRRLRAHMKYVTPEPRIHTWVQTYHLARSLVRNRQGLAVVDMFTARDEDDPAIQTRTLEPHIDVPLYLVYRTGSQLTSVQSTFLRHVRELAESLLKS